MTPTNHDIDARAAGIRLVLFDVDGVLTDGRVLVHSDGTESKSFAIRDGIAMVWAQRYGIRVGFLSARLSSTTPHRAAQLGVTLVYHGVTSKLATYERILADLGLDDSAVAYMGDDVVDIAVLECEKRPVNAVADHQEVKSINHVRIRQARDMSVSILSDSDYSWSERILSEQFSP